jgi:hypothetical protein
MKYFRVFTHLKTLMKAVFLLSLFSSFVLTADAQQKLLLYKRIETNASLLFSDALGNYFLVSGNILSKYSPEGDFLRSYSNMKSGPPAWIDPSDPLKILVFHKDFSLLRYLNDEMAVQRDEVSLITLGLTDPVLVCASFDNAFWTYDGAGRQLTRFDSRLRKNQESGDISQITGKNFQPEMMMELGHILYVNDPQTGILVFDRYAAYLRTIPVTGIEYFQVYGDHLFFLKDGCVSTYHLIEKNLSEIMKVPAGSKAFRIENKRFYLLTADALEIYIPE